MKLIDDKFPSRPFVAVVFLATGVGLALIALGTARTEPWGFGWTAVGSIATALAVVVALFLPWRERRLREEERRQSARRLEESKIAHTRLVAPQLADAVYKLQSQFLQDMATISRLIDEHKRAFPPHLAVSMDIHFDHLKDVALEISPSDLDLVTDQVREQIIKLSATRRALISLTAMMYNYPHGGHRDAKRAIQYNFYSLMEIIESSHVTCLDAMEALERCLPPSMHKLREGMIREGVAFGSFGDLARKVGTLWVFPPEQARP